MTRRIPKRHVGCPQILSIEEVARVIDAADSLSHRTMLMVLYSTVKGAQIPSRRKVVLVNHAAKPIATLDSSTAPIGMS